LLPTGKGSEKLAPQRAVTSTAVSGPPQEYGVRENKFLRRVPANPLGFLFLRVISDGQDALGAERSDQPVSPAALVAVARGRLKLAQVFE